MIFQAHPSPGDLALLCGGDLSLAKTLRLKLHIASCTACRRSMQAFRAQRDELSSEAADLPSGLDWDSLAAEMTANIHLGLAAGSIVRPVPEEEIPAPPWRWQTGLVAASLTLVLVSVYWLRHSQVTAPSAVQTVVLALPADSESTMADFGGVERARQLDGETGRVTITQVYVE